MVRVLKYEKSSLDGYDRFFSHRCGVIMSRLN